MNPNVVRQQHSDDPQQPELLRVCRIGRAQGLKGEVTVQSFTDEPEYRFAAGSVLYARDGSEEYVVEHARTFKNRWIIKFESIENRDDAEAANGTELYGEADDPEDMLEEDAWYPKDLIGLEVRLAPARWSTCSTDSSRCSRCVWPIRCATPRPAKSPRTAPWCRSSTRWCRTSISMSGI